MNTANLMSKEKDNARLQTAFGIYVSSSNGELRVLCRAYCRDLREHVEKYNHKMCIKVSCDNGDQNDRWARS
jgi:hypothetical protein